MEKCFKCDGNADFICPDCGTKMCWNHSERRYRGSDRGFKSRFMCPKCWKTKRKVLNEDMVNAKTYKPKKTYSFSK